MGVVVPLEEDRGRGQNAVAQLQALVATEMEAVNEFIRERMASDVPMIPDLASHLINSGGKRLRPPGSGRPQPVCLRVRPHGWL